MEITTPDDQPTGGLHKRAREGIRLLLVRQVVIQVLTFGGGIVLARVLDPADFGLFGITTFVVNTLAMFADAGVAKALIQRKEDLTAYDLHVAFTLQQVMITTVGVLLWILAPTLAGLYPKADDALVWLIRAMVFNLYLSSWQSMSVLQLERALNYKKLAVVEVIQKLSYQAIAVVMAVLGFGVWSLVVAVLARSGLGTVMIYRAAPWTVRFRFDRAVARDILRVGIPFQVQGLVGNVRGWVTPTLVASLIGPDAVGFLTWASSIGRKPLVFIQNVIRVSFPHFSRLQHREEEVERLLASYLTNFLIATGLWVVILFVAGHDLVAWIYTDKWLPAVPALVLYGLLLSFNAINWTVKSALGGLGHIRFATRVTLIDAVVTVVLSIGLVLTVGFIGVPIAALVGMAMATPWLFAGFGRPGSLRRIFAPARWIVVPVLLAAAVGLGARQLALPLALRALASAAAVVLGYGAGVWWAAPDAVRQGIAARLARWKTRLRPVKV